MTSATYSASSQAGRHAAPNFGVGMWIERRARRAPDRAALVWGERELTYADLAARIRRLANGMRALGVGHGDRVAWLGENHPAFLESLFAAGLIGAALAPINHRLPASERAFVLEDTEPVLLIERDSVDRSPVPNSVRDTIVVGEAPGRATDYETLVAESAETMPHEHVDADDLLMLPHTSGTTGRPKGVMLSHGNVTWNAINLLASADVRPDDVTIAIAPFFRVGGTGVNVLPVLFLGGTVVVPQDSRPETLLELTERHRVTVGFGNPDLLDSIARSDRWPDADLSATRFFITGGAPVPERLVGTYLDRGVMLVQGYGLSEAAPIVLLLDPVNAARKMGSAGLPPAFVDVAIEDSEGAEAAAGEIGELLVRGPNVMGGYWRRPDATREVLTSDGWLRTGDAARADDEGFIWIVDRVSSRISTEGGPVYPWEVERELLAHPSVADAGVVGVPATHGSATPVAFVAPAVPRAIDTDELLTFARARLPAHAAPTSIMVVPELPRTSVGKLRRDVLLAWTMEDQDRAIADSD